MVSGRFQMISRRKLDGVRKVSDGVRKVSCGASKVSKGDKKVSDGARKGIDAEMGKSMNLQKIIVQVFSCLGKN